MPLFQFHYNGSKFKFSDDYSLEHFDSDEDIHESAKSGLSDIDLSCLRQEDWALVATNPNDKFKSELNMLLISFRIFAKSNAFIKWRFCTENQKYSTRLNDRFRNLLTMANLNITEKMLTTVKNGFLQIVEMYNISDRTKNTFYFTWRGLCVEKHMDAYILLVCALESLFSNETAEDVTKTVIKRIQKFLSRKGFGGDQIKKIYQIRSDMVHGRISHTDKKDTQKRKNNLDNLGKLEELLFVCLQKLIDGNLYRIYGDTEKKEKYFNELIGDNPTTSQCTRPFPPLRGSKGG